LANHRFFDGSKLEMVKRCLKMTIALRSNSEEVGRFSKPSHVWAEVEIRAVDVGHRVPTGFADRNLLLVIEAFDRDGRPIAPRTGPLLPLHVGKSMAGRPGRLYAKQLSAFDGRRPAPFWRAQPDPDDSRLTPGQADRISYCFPAGTTRVRVRLLYRRFWEEAAILKNWPDNETELVEQTFSIIPGREVRWMGP
jgi:hypothetical protein